MSNQQHPITPPPLVREQWHLESPFKVISLEREDYMIDRATQWGADQELIECLRYASDNGLSITRMRTARRPKPPSLKERLSKAIIAGDEREALKLLEGLDD